MANTGVIDPITTPNPGDVNWDARDDARDPWKGPRSRNEQIKTAAALAANIMPHAAVKAVRPPLPQVRLNPSRHGYGPRPLGIGDIIELNRDYQPRVDWSGGLGSYSGASRNSLGNG